MVMTVNDKQNRTIMLVIGALGALGGITAFLIYLDRQKHIKIQGEILKLDREIKELQLSNLKKG